MSDETQVVRPLNDVEIKDIIAQHCAEKIREALNSTCWLHGMAWPKFRIDPSRINITLANMYGEEKEIFVNVDLPVHEVHLEGTVLVGTLLVGGTIRDGKELPVDVELPYTPPNVLRKQHGLPIPTVVRRDDGSTEQKAVVFRQKRGRNVEDAE